jgi:hypothetical protein
MQPLLVACFENMREDSKTLTCPEALTVAKAPEQVCSVALALLLPLPFAFWDGPTARSHNHLILCNIHVAESTKLLQV